MWHVIGWGAVGGSITGTVKDQTNRVLAGVMVVATNVAQGIHTKTLTGDSGTYAFPSLPVGTYEIEFQLSGFRSLKRTGIVINSDSALREDATLQLALQVQDVTVKEDVIQIDTESTQMGQVVT